MRFRMRCHLKTAPNIGEVSFVSAFSHYLNGMSSRRSRAPQTSGPYALYHPFPPTSDAPACKDKLVNITLKTTRFMFDELKTIICKLKKLSCHYLRVQVGNM